MFSQRAFIFKKCTMLKTSEETKFVSASAEEQKPNKNQGNVRHSDHSLITYDKNVAYSGEFSRKVRVFAFLLVCFYERKEMQSDLVPKCGQMSRLMCAKTSLKRQCWRQLRKHAVSPSFACYKDLSIKIAMKVMDSMY